MSSVAKQSEALLGRRGVLVASFFVAASFYAALYAVAPHVMLLSPNADTLRLPERVRVNVLDASEVPEIVEVSEAPAPMASRPGSVRDLLARETESLPLAEAELPRADGTSIGERLGEEILPRDHNLTADADVAASAEARILEITQDAARREIEIARRYVRPSSSRLLDKGDLPTFVGPGDGRGGAIPLGGLGAGVLGGAEGGAEAGDLARDEGAAPEWEEGVFLSEFEVSGLPVLPEETLIGSEFSRRSIEAESPFEQMDRLVSVEAATYVDPRSGEGFFRLRIVPKADETVPVLSKDVTFVVDASNSISQRKLDLTVRGLQEALGLLRAGDRFNVVVFRDTPRMFRDVLADVTAANVEAARRFLDNLESTGSTDVYRAIGSVIANVPRTGNPGIIIVISDGRPSSGNLAGRELINRLSAENLEGNTIFTFGGGKTVNRYLMDLLAYRNRGVSHVAPRLEDIDEHLPRFVARLNDGILVDLRADYGRIDAETVFPREVPDFYRGKAVEVYGKYDPARDEDVVLRLEGLAGSVKKDLVFKSSLRDAEGGGAEIAKSWAFEKSYYLIGETTRVGETPELMAELKRLSDAYGVRTSYTP